MVLMAIIRTRSPEELSNFIEKEISTSPGILRTETFVNLDIIKEEWPGYHATPRQPRALLATSRRR